MKKTFLFLLAVIAAGIAMSVAQEKPREKARNPEVEELRARVDQLQARVQTLETRLSQLEAARHAPVPIVPAPSPLNSQKSSPILNFTPQPQQSPKIWGEREVNGWTFYVVPCGTAAR